MLPQKITVSQDVGVSIPGFGLSKQHFDASVQRNPVFSAIQWAYFFAEPYLERYITIPVSIVSSIFRAVRPM